MTTAWKPDLLNSIADLNSRLRVLEQSAAVSNVAQASDGSDISGDIQNNYGDTSIKIFVQTTTPSGLNSSTDVGSLWVNAGVTKFWDGFAWQSYTASTVWRGGYGIDALNAAVLFQSQTSLIIYSQGTAPSTHPINTIWKNGAVIQRWNGSAWVTITDTNLTGAINTAVAAADMSDSQLQVFFQASAPGGSHGLGDLWFETDNQLYPWQWDGASWVNYVHDDRVLPETDGLVPPYSPAPTTTGGLGAIFLRWSPVVNHDPVTYDVYISTASGTQGAIVVSTTASQAVVRTYSDGSVLNYFDGSGAVQQYYFTIVARDDDGSATPSAQVPGTMDQTAQGDLAVNSVTAEVLDSILSMASIITTRGLDGTGNPTGQGVDITPQGIYSYDSAGNKRVEMPNDPLQTAVWRGDAEIDHLTVQTLTTLIQTVLSAGATFQLLNGVQDPAQPPTVQGTIFDGFTAEPTATWSTRSGLAGSTGAVPNVAGGYLFTVDGTTLKAINPSTFAVVASKALHTNVDNICFVPYNPAHFLSNAVLCIGTDTVSGAHQVEVVTYPNAGTPFNAGANAILPWSGSNGTRAAAIAYDLTADEVIIAQSRASNSDKIHFQRYTFTTSTTGFTSVNSNWDSNNGYAVNLAGLYYGSADFGSNMYVTSSQGTTLVDWHAFNSTGVEQTGLTWDKGSDSDVVPGLYYDGTNFWSVDKPSSKWIKYAGGNYWWTTGNKTATWYAAYAWYDGTHITRRSTVRSYTQWKRSRVLLQSPNLPGTVTQVGFYLLTTNPAGSNGNMWLQSFVTPAGTPSLIPTNPVFSGTNDSTSNTFPSAAASQVLDANGNVMLNALGDSTLVGMPHIDAYRTSNITVANNTVTPMGYGTDNSPKVGITYDGTSIYTVPEAGIYMVNASKGWPDPGGSGTTGRRQIAIYINGSQAMVNAYGSSGTTNACSTITGVFKLAANATVEIRILQTSGVSQTETSDQQHDYLQIEKLH